MSGRKETAGYILCCTFVTVFFSPHICEQRVLMKGPEILEREEREKWVKDEV